MDGWSGDMLLKILETDITHFHQNNTDNILSVEDTLNDNLDYLRTLVAQSQGQNSGPLLPKTPKIGRKKAIHRIETIPEDEVTDFESTTTERTDDIREEEPEIVPEEPTGRTRRTASKKAADSIRKQQSQTLIIKMRRPTEEGEASTRSSKATRESRSKRPKASLTSSDEDEAKRPSKHSKVEKKHAKKRNTQKHTSKGHKEAIEVNIEDEESDPSLRLKVERTSTVKRKHRETKTPSPRHSNHSSTLTLEPAAKKQNVFDETVDKVNADTTFEASLYEDAISKPVPIMNSTMNYGNTTMTLDKNAINTTATLDTNINSTVTLDKNTPAPAQVNGKNVLMNMTVVLEPLPPSIHMNETVVLQKDSTSKPNSRKNSNARESRSRKNNKTNAGSPPPSSKSTRASKNGLQDRLETLKEVMANKEFEELFTDDESSPEIEKKLKGKVAKQPVKPERVTRTSLLTEDGDEVMCTPEKKPTKNILQDMNGMQLTAAKVMRNTYKPNALFSPYAKDSVRKRVEAFEQVGLNSPKAVEIDAPTRLTRTKTRAMAAAEAAVNPAPPMQTVAQKLARKSLAKAKKISLVKQMKDNEEYKENQTAPGSLQKPSRILALNEKLMQKQQQRTTPIGRSRLQQPMSVSRIAHTPSNLQPLSTHTKAMSASRTNIVTMVDSFIQQPKTVQKSSLTDKIEEKRRKAHEEDARRKREEALKIQTEEKRRKREEKELKNKLAREAKEKLDMEKRLKAEREKEEKARIALQIQERQREEIERKRIAQQQRAQEKEEKRRQEEQLRFQRLQEQEEAERQLAEQKRKEQEAAERQHQRRLAEARAQQQAAAEAAKQKSQYLAGPAKAKYANNTFTKPQAPTNYVIDSDPDDDDSDDENKPKHSIPIWAKAQVRMKHLAMQEYVNLKCAQKFFDSKKCTPDLTQLFKGIDKSRLKRTSSAIWKTPPRYSMMYRE